MSIPDIVIKIIKENDLDTNEVNTLIYLLCNSPCNKIHNVDKIYDIILANNIPKDIHRTVLKNAIELKQSI